MACSPSAGELGPSSGNALSTTAAGFVRASGHPDPSEGFWAAVVCRAGLRVSTISAVPPSQALAPLLLGPCDVPGSPHGAGQEPWPGAVAQEVEQREWAWLTTSALVIAMKPLSAV